MPGMHHLRVILQKETSSQKGYIFKIIVAFMKHINKVKIITGKRKKKDYELFTNEMFEKTFVIFISDKSL